MTAAGRYGPWGPRIFQKHRGIDVPSVINPVGTVMIPRLDT
jgi:hypothetical protein